MTQLTQFNPFLQQSRFDGSQKNEQTDLQRAAMEFEAMLLMQLTAALNVSSDDEEGSLFGSDSGTSLSKQMFSEHLAMAMSKAGGIGLAETLLRQIQGNQPKQDNKLNNNLSKSPRSISTSDIVKETKPASFENTRIENKPLIENISQVENNFSIENKPLLQTPSVVKPSISSELSAPSKPFEKLSASQVTQYVADLAKVSGKAENFVPVEKSVNKANKAKVQNSSNEMFIVSEASQEDVEASKNYDYSSINDSNLTRVYKQSGLIDNQKTKANIAEKSSDKLPTTATSIDPINTKAATPAENPTKAEKNTESKVTLDWPLRGVVRSNYGTRKDPINGKHKFHQGLDIAAKRGTPIASSADGVVVFSGWGKKYGNNVVIEHPDGRRTRYAHADKLFVKEGETVIKGQEIAAVGSTGRSTGPHLHFEVIENGKNVNPLKALANGFQIVRR